MQNKVEVTVHGFSSPDMREIANAMSRAISTPISLRLISSPGDVKLPPNIQLERLDMTRQWSKLNSVFPGEDAHSRLLRSKEILPKQGGPCLVNVLGDASSLSLCMFLLNQLVHGRAFDRLVIVSPMAIPLFDLAVTAAGPDRKLLDLAFRERRLAIVGDISAGLDFLLPHLGSVV